MYKPQLVCELLQIGFSTFRYWRENIEPLPHRKSFSAGDVLVFRIIKILIVKKHLSAELLSSFSFSVIFSVCGSAKPEALSEQYLLLDESDHSVHFFPTQHAVDPFNLDHHVLRLAPVVIEHQNAFWGIGNNPISLGL